MNEVEDGHVFSISFPVPRELTPAGRQALDKSVTRRVHRLLSKLEQLRQDRLDRGEEPEFTAKDVRDVESELERSPGLGSPGPTSSAIAGIALSAGSLVVGLTAPHLDTPLEGGICGIGGAVLLAGWVLVWSNRRVRH